MYERDHEKLVEMSDEIESIAASIKIAVVKMNEQEKKVLQDE